MDALSDGIKTLLSDPETVKKFADIASSLKSYPSPEKASPEKTPPVSELSGIISELENNSARRRELLFALRPFLSPEKCARMDDVLRTLSVAEAFSAVMKGGK